MPDDPYLYPGSNTLRNRLSIRDPAALQLVEYALTSKRAGSAPLFPATAAGYLAGHRHLFQDIYDWAGKLRTVEISKGGNPFASATYLAGNLDKRFADLAMRSNTRGLDAGEFASIAAHHISELNALHPFREGNGRAMRLHLTQLAGNAGHALGVTRMPAAEWIAASIESFRHLNEQPLAALIKGALQTPAIGADAQRQGRLTENPVSSLEAMMAAYVGPASPTSAPLPPIAERAAILAKRTAEQGTIAPGNTGPARKAADEEPPARKPSSPGPS